jgi:hypothetical protein
MKVIIAVALLGIVASLGQALFAMSSGPDRSGRVVRALTVRIALSLALFAALMIGWHLGLIEPLGNR